MSDQAETPRVYDREDASAHALRTLPGAARMGLSAFMVGLALLHIYFNTLGTWPELWTSVIHFSGFGFLCALLYPAWHGKTPGSRRAALAVDLALALLSLAVAAHLILGEEAFYAAGTAFRWTDWVFTVVAALLAIEFTRRTSGLIIPVMIVIAFTYVVWWGRYVPGMLTFPGLSLETMLFRSFYTEDGMFGNLAQISSGFVFMFILFGAFLMRSGAGTFIIDFARATTGRLTGGPGFVAVLGSALFGTISGSAVANTVSTGVITIPLMKRAGFSPKFAAGVEATASTGGQLMPPVMGAGAFIMANYTQVSYLTIAAVSILPAILYFISVAAYIRIRATKYRLTLVDDEAPRLIEVLKTGGLTFFVPVAVLIGMLVAGYTPTFAAGFGIAAAVVASWLTPNPMGPRAVIEALEMGCRNMILTAVLLIAIGLVVNAVATTGLGNTFSLMITRWAGSNLFIALVLVALASLVLGMGLPVTASYVVLATLSAPALADLILRNELIQVIADGNLPDAARAVLMLVAPDRAATLGQPMSSADAEALLALVPAEMTGMMREQLLSAETLTVAILSAHMIIFWLSQDSNVTPPVCIVAFAAAAIAKSPPMATGFTAWRLAKGLYIVPFLFAYTPFLGLDVWVDLEIALFAALALYAFAAAFEGHGEAALGWPLRIVLFACCIALLWPNERLLHLGGAAVFVAVMAFNLRAARRAGRPDAAAAQPHGSRA